VAEKLIDAVVNISTSQTVKGPEGVPLPRVPKGAPFEEFFEDFFNRKGGRSPSDRKVSSLGSGFVVDGKEGLVVTNNHVIDGADEIIVNFNDGTKLKVEKVLGKDTKTDLALLKVTPKKPLPSVPFGSSNRLKVGDWVMAIGNPFGLGGSVTVGIISAKQRDINSGPYDDYLQTDAAINKGNSGGPLFNMDGEVIGVNTAIISPTGGSIGIGFAVPSDTATIVVDQLRQFGETRRGWLGVKIQTITDDMAEAYGVKEHTGALVASVTPDSPAAKAGIQDGDLILKFDGKDVTSMRGLPRLVAQTPIGKDVDVELLRKGQRTILKVAIGRLVEESEPVKSSAKEAPKGKGKAKDRDRDKDSGKAPTPSRSSLIGLVLAPLNDELRTKHNIGKDMKGVIVLEVDPASPAAERGVKVGDVIVEVAQDAVTSLDDITKSVDKVKKAGRKAVLLRLEDGKGDLRFVAVPVQ
jgi:serine protease Do